ncbi:MAG: type IV pilus secretin PilQ [Acidobacteriota bacterium]|nr:type IV pilus secretin PilQ [Acidobacteriota bacterium]
MKIRSTIIRNLASGKAKGTVLLLLLAFAIPRLDHAQDRSVSSKSPQQQPAPAALAKGVGTGTLSQEAAGAKPAVRAGAITDVKVVPEGGKLILSVSADRPVAPKELILDNPPRLVLDFPDTENKVQFSKLAVGSPSVKQVRVQQFQNSPTLITRIVCDLEKGYGSHDIDLDNTSVRLVFQGEAPKPPQAASAPTVKPASTAAAKAETRSVQARTEETVAKTASGPAVPALPPAGSEVAKAARPASEPKARPAIATAKGPIDTAPLVAALTPVSIPASPRPVQAASTRYTGQPLTLDLIDMPLVDFFRLMAEEGGINIVVDPDVKGTISIKGEKIPWDQVFDMALATRSLDKQIEGNLVRITRKATLQEEARQREALKKANLLAADLETRIKRLNYAKAEALLKAITDQKTVRGSIVLDERTNSLILTDIPSALDRLAKLIETLDIPQPQVEIEARIVSATRDFARAIGIQFGFVDGNLQRVTVGGPNTFGTIGGTRPSATPTSTFAAGNLATGRGASKGEATTSGAISTGATQDQGNYNVNLPAAKAFGGLGISVGNIFDTFLLDAAITAGESKGLAKLISQPKVTAQNNSSATITQGVRFPVPVVANNTVTVQFYNAALTLVVTPQITYEGNIVLDLKVENNTADWANNVEGVPSIRTSESNTRVLVSDGGTTVIGGILVDSESNSEDKVPGLGSLPVVGNLFRRTSVTRSTQEVLFFVTPRIIK